MLHPSELSGLYNRQQDLDVLVPTQMAIVGVGGIGYFVAVNAAMLGAEKIILFDSDVLELHNLNRLPYGQDDLGKNKAQACREVIQRIRPNASVFAFGNIDEFNISSLSELTGRRMVYICTDTLESQKMIRDYCREHEIRFMRLGYDGRHFTIENKPEMPLVWTETEPDEDEESAIGRYSIVPSYTITPQLVALSALMIYDMAVPLDREIEVTANIFHIGQVLLNGSASDSVPLEYEDRRAGGTMMVDPTTGGRIR